MALGRERHRTKKKKYGFSKEWSGVSGAPHSDYIHCHKEVPPYRTHLECGEHYCPYCDDYISLRELCYSPNKENDKDNGIC